MSKSLLLCSAAAILASALGTAACGPRQPSDPDTISATGGDLTIRPITHGSVLVSHAADMIFVDPAPPSGLYSNLPKATLVLVTHDHEDHFDTGIIQQVSTPSTKVVVSRSLERRVPNAVTMRNGDQQTFGDVKVTAVAMYNTASSYHVRGDGNGYVVTVGGKRLYFAGDTECVADPQALQSIDIAFLPMNLPFTMSPSQAADCAKAFKPRIVYPYHFRPSNPQDFANAMAGTSTEVRLRKWY